MNAPRDAAVPGTRRRGAWTFAFAALLLVAFAGFLALGAWQLQRMAWKHALVARVEARVHAPAVDAPARARWPAVSEAGDGYRRVRVSGHFIAGVDARTQAVTELGAGTWTLAPLRTDGGDVVLVNRGFTPAGQTAAPAPRGRVRVEGLLRISEPVGGFLRRNDPARGRWYSRDVAAIARAQGLPAGDVAPYFIDAVRVPPRAGAPAQWPRGGMTVVAFRDAHLSYALTWFGMALLTAFAGARLFASERGLRQDRLQRPGQSAHARAIQPS